MKQECDLLKKKPLDQTNKDIIMEIKHSNEAIEQLKKSLQSLKRSHGEDKRTVKRLKTSNKNVVSENKKGKQMVNYKALVANYRQKSLPLHFYYYKVLLYIKQ